MAGVTVGIVALPLALAFGITTGAGARAGLITAIYAGLIAAVFGGSNYQVSGPTGAMTVVLVSDRHQVWSGLPRTTWAPSWSNSCGDGLHPPRRAD